MAVLAVLGWYQGTQSMFWDRLDVWSLVLHRAPQASPGKAGGTKPSHASRAQVPHRGSSPTYVFTIFLDTYEIVGVQL